MKLKMIMPEDCKPQETVVFFDKIQKCPEIVTKIKFSITVLKNNVPIPDTEIRYQISEDMMKPHKEGILQAEGSAYSL